MRVLRERTHRCVHFGHSCRIAVGRRAELPYFSKFAALIFRHVLAVTSVYLGFLKARKHMLPMVKSCFSCEVSKKLV
jgi:hypothetical protein